MIIGICDKLKVIDPLSAASPLEEIPKRNLPIQQANFVNSEELISPNENIVENDEMTTRDAARRVIDEKLNSQPNLIKAKFKS